MSPILPLCLSCCAEVSVQGGRQTGGPLILLNGGCATGKSATAEELMRLHGWFAIDSDCVVQTVKHRLSLEKPPSHDSPEVLAEIEYEIAFIRALGYDIAFAHVVTPDMLPSFADMFSRLSLDWRHILLRPDYGTALARSKTRTCHKSVTPEEWVRYFYDKLIFDEREAIVFDNSPYTTEQSVRKIIELCGFA